MPSDTWDVYLQRADEYKLRAVAKNVRGRHFDVARLYRPRDAGACVVVLPAGHRPPALDARIVCRRIWEGTGDWKDNMRLMRAYAHARKRKPWKLYARQRLVGEESVALRKLGMVRDV